MDGYCSAVRLGGMGDEAFFLGDRQPVIPVRWSGDGGGANLGVETCPDGAVLMAGGPGTLLWLHADIPVMIRSGCARTLILCELFVNGEPYGCDGGVTALGELRFFHLTALVPAEQPVNRVECTVRFPGDIGSVTGTIPQEHRSLRLMRGREGLGSGGLTGE
ncbi:MAG: hypothetical protein HFE85_05210 [Clostridiales bacterium]|nr:hypothetical protein [Clostridiales bacterium]